MSKKKMTREELEDIEDSRLADERIEEIRKGAPTIPHEEVWKEENEPSPDDDFLEGSRTIYEGTGHLLLKKNRSRTENSNQSVELLEEISGPLSFGLLLKNERENLELNQIQMAEKLGISPEEIKAIEEGKGDPTIKNAIDLGKLSGKSPEIYIQLVLQKLLDDAGVKYCVSVKRSENT